MFTWASGDFEFPRINDEFGGIEANVVHKPSWGLIRARIRDGNYSRQNSSDTHLVSLGV